MLESIVNAKTNAAGRSISPPCGVLSQGLRDVFQ